ncbi:MAG: hypothetical protein E6Q97_13470 [Desulfurellales bacterium]|nr:MAG: hypothetical protein E6Q97_13470 [Desulfurellales bacterium]
MTPGGTPGNNPYDPPITPNPRPRPRPGGVPGSDTENPPGGDTDTDPGGGGGGGGGAAGRLGGGTQIFQNAPFDPRQRMRRPAAQQSPMPRMVNAQGVFTGGYQPEMGGGNGGGMQSPRRFNAADGAGYAAKAIQNGLGPQAERLRQAWQAKAQSQNAALQPFLQKFGPMRQPLPLTGQNAKF